MKFSQNSFSKNIQAAIASKGLSVPKFADLLGVSKTTVYNWIHGRNRIQPERVEEVAALLEVSPGWLMGYLETSEVPAAPSLSPSHSTAVAPVSASYTTHPSSGTGSSEALQHRSSSFSYTEEPRTRSVSNFTESVAPLPASNPAEYDVPLSASNSTESGTPLSRQVQEMPGEDPCKQAQDMIRHIVTELMELQTLFTNSSER